MTNPNQAVNSYVSWKTFNGQKPLNGPRAVNVSVNFAINNPSLIDFSMAEQLDVIEGIQGIYADNSANPYPLVISSHHLNQVLTWPAYSQGYLPVLSSPPPKFIATSNGYSGTIQLQFTTFPVAAEIWSTLQSGGGSTTPNIVSPYGGSYNDYSGTITAGGSSQLVIAANTLRKNYLIENPVGATESLYGNFGVAASSGAGSFSLAPGGVMTATGNYSLQAIYLFALTTGHIFTAKELV